MGNVPVCFPAGWEWDGKEGSHLVDGMGGITRFLIDFLLGYDGTGPGKGPGNRSGT